MAKWIKKINVDGTSYYINKAATLTLAANNWSSKTQSVTVTDMTTTATVIVSPSPASIDAWTGAGVYCSSQATNSLTFKYTEDAAPAAITVNVLWTETEA